METDNLDKFKRDLQRTAEWWLKNSHFFIPSNLGGPIRIMSKTGEISMCNEKPIDHFIPSTKPEYGSTRIVGVDPTPIQAKGFYVFNRSGHNKPTKEHATYEAAKAELDRLSHQEGKGTWQILAVLNTWRVKTELEIC